MANAFRSIDPELYKFNNVDPDDKDLADPDPELYKFNNVDPDDKDLADPDPELYKFNNVDPDDKDLVIRIRNCINLIMWTLMIRIWRIRIRNTARQYLKTHLVLVFHRLPKATMSRENFKFCDY